MSILGDGEASAHGPRDTEHQSAWTFAENQRELRVWEDARNDPWQSTEHHYGRKDIPFSPLPASV